MLSGDWFVVGYMIGLVLGGISPSIYYGLGGCLIYLVLRLSGLGA
jgi:hypothetical protein